MTRVVAVIDTNVVVAAILTNDLNSPTARIFDAMRRGTFSLLLSKAVLSEYREVLIRTRIRSLHNLRGRDVDLLLTELATNGIFREPKPVQGSPDPNDAHVWSLAHSEPDCVVVTGDHALIEAPLSRTPVLNPRQLVERYLQ